jgi:hypothetical protein
MRDFHDAKVMAHALLVALKGIGLEITRSQSLELIAKAFGYADWNILSSKLEAASRPREIDLDPWLYGAQEPELPKQEPEPPKTLYCSFCGKSQHEVRKLIAGPGSVCICDECVELCVGIGRDERGCEGHS